MMRCEGLPLRRHAVGIVLLRKRREGQWQGHVCRAAGQDKTAHCERVTTDEERDCRQPANRGGGESRWVVRQRASSLAPILLRG